MIIAERRNISERRNNMHDKIIHSYNFSIGEKRFIGRFIKNKILGNEYIYSGKRLFYIINELIMVLNNRYNKHIQNILYKICNKLDFNSKDVIKNLLMSSSENSPSFFFVILNIIRRERLTNSVIYLKKILKKQKRNIYSNEITSTLNYLGYKDKKTGYLTARQKNIRVSFTTCIAWHQLINDLISTPPRGVDYFHSFIEYTNQYGEPIRKLSPDNVYAVRFISPQKIIFSDGWPVVNKIPWVLYTGDFTYPYMAESSFLNKLHFKGYTYPIEDIKKEIKKRMDIMCYNLYSDYCKKILTRSKWCADYINSVCRDDIIKNKIEVLYPAHEVFRFKKKKSIKTKLIYVGRNFYRKGGKDALEVFALAAKKYKNILLYFIGEIPKKYYIKYSKYENIIFIPLISHQDVFRYMSQSDIYISTTKYEPFGITYLEAMSFKLPIVCTSSRMTPAISEIVENGKNGYIVPCIEGENTDIVDKKTVADRIAGLIENKSLMNQLGNNGFELVRTGKFSVKKRNDRLLRIFNTIAADFQ